MNRREFLAAAGGSALAPPAGARSCPWTWIAHWQAPHVVGPEFDAPSAALTKSRTFTKAPADGEKVVDFVPTCSKPVPRPLWSELKKDRTLRKRVTGDLKRAYHKLLCRDDRDPTSLLHQAWLHDYYCGPDSPFRDIHNTWDFLPWHRAFLYFHERIVAAACGNPDFRLPVWDWEADLRIPEFYASLGVPSFIDPPARKPAMDPTVQAMFSESGLRAWLLSQDFASFCGTPAADANPPRCSAGPPHSAVHIYVVGGSMQPSATAAGDPVFYAHHANVDRFFGYWLNRYSTFEKPAEWLDRAYCLYDERGRLVRVRTRQLLYEGLLGYAYPRDPTVCLYDYQAFDAEKSRPPFAAGLLTGLLTATLGAELGDGPHTGNEVRDLVKAIESEGAGRAPSLPVRIRVKLAPGTVQAGILYELVVANGTDTAPIGGFGIFGHQHANAADGRTHVFATGSTTPRVLQILGASQTLDLRYRALNGPPQLTPIRRQDVEVFEILAPQGALALGQQWLGNLNLHF